MNNSITFHFFSDEQKRAKNRTDEYIHKKMKKIGIRDYLIRKHIHIIVNPNESLNFNENDSFEKSIKDCITQMGSTGIIYLSAK